MVKQYFAHIVGADGLIRERITGTAINNVEYAVRQDVYLNGHAYLGMEVITTSVQLWARKEFNQGTDKHLHYLRSHTKVVKSIAPYPHWQFIQRPYVDDEDDSRLFFFPNILGFYMTPTYVREGVFSTRNLWMQRSADPDFTLRTWPNGVRTLFINV